MERPAVSVIVPTWNQAHTLEAAISSCLAQTLLPLEILVCDDGSSDASAEVVKGIGDSRVVWLPGPRSNGPAGPRNRGIAASRGAWLAFLDSDDEWLPLKLERQLQAATRLQCKAVSANAVRKVAGELTDRQVVQWANERITLSDLLICNHVVCSSAIVHSSLMPVVGGFVEGLSFKSFADYTCWLRVATLTDFAFVPENLVIYRDDPQASLRVEDLPTETMHRVARRDLLRWAGDHPDLGRMEKIHAVRRFHRSRFLQAKMRNFLSPLVWLKRRRA